MNSLIMVWNKLTFLILAVIFYSCHSNSETIVKEEKANYMHNYDDFFELTQEGKKYKIPILPIKEIKSILSSSETVKLENVIYSEFSLNVYKTKNGVLSMQDGDEDAPLYPSEKVLLYHLKNYSYKSHPILEGINIYEDRFPQFAQKLTSDFLNKVHIRESNLPLNILKAVDEQINTNRTKQFFNENFLALIALVGELINKEYHSNWIMVKSDETWTPAISYKGQKIFFDHYILLDYDNKKEKSPILNSYLTIGDIIKFNLNK